MEEIDIDRLMAFARDNTLKIYRLKGCFRLMDGRKVVLHKVGSDVMCENTSVAFEKSQLVAIGAKPDFSPARMDKAWTEIISRPSKPSDSR